MDYTDNDIEQYSSTTFRNRMTGEYDDVDLSDRHTQYNPDNLKLDYDNEDEPPAYYDVVDRTIEFEREREAITVYQTRMTGEREGIRDRHLPNRHLPDRDLPDRHLPDRYLPDRHLPDRHLPDRHLPDRSSLYNPDNLKLDSDVNDEPPYDNVKEYVDRGCVIVSTITENILMHPFLVLRRQCQINPMSKRYHLMPVTLIPIIIRLYQTQGVNALWKGVGSTLVVRGLSMAVEDIITKLTYLPKEIGFKSFKMFAQHIILKCVTIGIVTPFYSASLVETVQSQVASEKPGVLDIFRDGLRSLFKGRNKGRLIPVYVLLLPTVGCGILKYLFSLLVKSVTGYIIKNHHKYSQKSRGAYSRVSIPTSKADDIEFQSILISLWTAEVVFYPFETIIERLHLQGTRTIIDDLDTGRSVTAMLTDYSGIVHCYQTIVSTEGVLGLYKGFGALVIQLVLHALVLKASKWIFTRVGAMMKPEQESTKSYQRFY